MAQQFTGTVEVLNSESGKVTIILEGGDDEGGGNLILGGSGQDGDLVLRDSQGRQRIFMIGGQSQIRFEQPGGALGTTSIFLDGQSGNVDAQGSARFTGKVEVRNTESGQTTVLLDGGDDEGGGNLVLGGSGQDGDLVLRDSQGRQRVFMVGGQGDIRLEQADGSISVFLDGEAGHITAGGPGTPGGVVSLRDAGGSTRISLDAGTGEIITTGDVLIRDSIPFPDYVLEDDYPLPSAADLASHIECHRRLPDVPSAQEIAAEGLRVGEFCALLLKKIEELTLLVIQQEHALADGASRLTRLERDRQPVRQSSGGRTR